MYNDIKIKNNSLQQPKMQPLKQNYRDQTSFNRILQNQILQNQEIKFSKHAIERLDKRNIHLSPQDIKRLNQAFGIASQKGIKETLIMMDNRVFVASVANKTIITAAVGDQLKESVFTNIDGAVMI
ncbi:TIGR02530 family flagellar biosynthesis protein [Alkaliphilus hydrothermalis]|uniref:Flagellar operon protein n=1 Tax=Alkaliphilus hydrothermalis TaxID=1482730 RepID=A0ABS2NL82_9FIRM|nr:TIGR02530 family flagellar biosynthesis protein [Alkaliphilus hydrothermalis]MBM7613662.1 flagellar operon protein [Alkaliphilus hydrothermalis]